jgi:sugar-phosphatase
MQSFSCSAILFDLDGVLVDSIASAQRAWGKFAARHNLDIVKVLEAAHARRSIETVRLLVPETDVEAENQIVEQDEIDDAEGLVATEGAAELLSIIPADRWTIVTSGTRPLATARLRAAGLPIPKHLVTADQVSNGKPHPEPYIKGASALGFSPHNCVVFEDAPAGIRAGQAAGAKVIGVVGTFEAAQLNSAQALVGSLAHLSVKIDKDGLTVRVPAFSRVTAR